MKKRILSFMLCLVMIAALMPVQKASADWDLSKYTFGVKTGTDDGAGTDSDIYIGFITADSSESNGYCYTNVKCDLDGDDFESGAYQTYTLSNSSYNSGNSRPGKHMPWHWTWLWIYHKGNGKNSNWQCKYVDISFPTLLGPNFIKKTLTLNKWLDDTSAWYALDDLNRRDISSWGGFDNWEQTVYVSDSSANSTTKLSWDNIITDQYGTYNPYVMEDSPKAVTVSVGYNTCASDKTTTLTNYFKSTFSTSNYSTSYSYNPKEVYNKMKECGAGKVTVTFTFAFGNNTVLAGDKTRTRTLTFYRQCFNMDSTPTYGNTWDVYGGSDNSYIKLNSDGTATATVYVKPSTLHCVSASTAECKSLADGFSFSSAKLRSGNSTSGTELCTLTKKSVLSDGRIELQGTIPAGKTTGGNGVTVVLEGVSSTYNSKTYKLDSGNTTWSAYISKLKVDTQKPTLTLKDSDKTTTLNTTNKIYKSLVFYPVSSEDLYKDTSKRASGSSSGSAARQISYTLTEQGKTNQISSGTAYPSGSVVDNAKCTVSTSGAAEGKYTLTFTGYDLAGNGIDTVKSLNVTLDSLAPRATAGTINSSVSAADKSKNYVFNYTVNDLCAETANRTNCKSWARLYYCFVPEGSSCPSLNKDSAVLTSGTIASNLNTWCYREPSNSGETVQFLLSVKLGDRFKGKLYLQTADSVGNSADLGSVSLDYSNLDVADPLSGTDKDNNTVPKKSFDLAFTSTVNGKSGTFTTQYRWVPEGSNATAWTSDGTSATLSMSLKNYTSGTAVGSAVQTGTDGKALTLHGTYRLEYVVTETTSGNKETFSRVYTFDNRKPVLTQTWNTANLTPAKTQQVTLKASDISGISTASYTVTAADGTPVGGGTLEPGTDGSLNKTVTLSPENSGVYTLTFKATDNNGETTEYDESTFVIRNQTPTVISAGIMPENYVQGVATVNAESANNYAVSILVEEPMLSAEYLTTEQTVRYAVSTDGINYSAWSQNESGMSADGNTLRKTITITTPATLSEGENTLYIKTCCSPTGTTAEPDAALISEVYEFTVNRDSVQPTVSTTEYGNTEPTNKPVTVTVTLSESSMVEAGFTPAEELVGVETPLDYTVNESGTVVTLTFGQSGTASLCLEDSAGNTNTETVSVENIDLTAPTVSSECYTEQTYYSKESLVEAPGGGRTDGRYSFNIQDENTVTLRYALLSGTETTAEKFTEAQFNAFENTPGTTTDEFTFENGKELREEIWLRGLTGSYALGIYAVDAAGNETWAKTSVLELADANPEVINSTSYPAVTTTTAKVTLYFNMNLVVLNPKNAVTADDLSEEEKTGKTEQQIAALVDNSNYEALYNIVSNWNQTEHSETESLYTQYYEVTCSNNEQQKLYVLDEVGRAFAITYACPNTTTFVEGLDVSAALTINGVAVENGGNIGFKATDTAEVTFTTDSKYTKQWFIADNLEGFTVDEVNSEKVTDTATVDSTALAKAGEGATIYNKLVLTVEHNGKTEKNAEIRVFTTGEGLSEADWQVNRLSFSSFDETAPTVTVSASTTEPTNNSVTVDARFSDSESGIESVSCMVDGVSQEVTGKTGHQFIAEKNCTIVYTVTNGAGLTTTQSYTVSNIDKTEITEGTDYTVSFEYKDYLGKWQPAETGAAYKTVRVNVTPVKTSAKTIEGTSKELTSADSAYAFTLRDAAGNTKEISGTWQNFDEEGGSIEYTLSTTAKINKSIGLTATITDSGSGIACAELRDSTGKLLAWDNTTGGTYEIYAESEEHPNCGIPASGIYTLTAWDVAGNSFSRQIVVTNIDKTVPTITDVLYSTPGGTITLYNVLATIQGFSKSNVTVTAVEPVAPLTASDFIHAAGSKEIRFKKNGSVSVTFQDEYGNVGYDVIGVDNIISTPPALKAVPVLAEDELSVTVTFDRDTDTHGVPLDLVRGLEDLFIVYQGISYNVIDEKTGQNTAFTLKANGDYRFTICDEAGNVQYIDLAVTEIDTKAPVIKSVSWSYEYLDEENAWAKKTTTKTLLVGTDTDGTEAGYVVASDVNPVTNSDVVVTVETDKPTKVLGEDTARSTKNSKTYYANGAYSFDLEAQNGTVTSYIVDIELIDKTAPVIGVKGASELVFIEGASSGTNAEYAYSKEKLMDYFAYDTYGGKTDLTDKVTIDYGGFDPDNINNNTFDRSKPYTITYKVYDKAGNYSVYRRTVRLVGMYDTLVYINGSMPNSTNSAGVSGDSIQVSLKNFSGKAYVRYASGVLTMGEMKTQGTTMSKMNGTYTAKNLKDGWYTVFVQTDKRDYFTITVLVKNTNN